MIVDSGASGTVVGMNMVKAVEATNVKSGIPFKLADGSRTPHMGEKTFKAYTEQGHLRHMVAAVTDVDDAAPNENVPYARSSVFWYRMLHVSLSRSARSSRLDAPCKSVLGMRAPRDASTMEESLPVAHGDALGPSGQRPCGRCGDP